MKLSENYIVHTSKSESILVPVGGSDFSGIVKGNAVLGELLSLLQKGTTEEALVSAMLERYDGPRDVIAGDVKAALAELRSIGALIE